MNFSFIVPRYAPVGSYYVFPIGIAYIVANMKHDGYDVHCLNLNHYDEPIDKLVSEHIKEHDIDVVCTGAMSFYWNEIEAILDASKATRSNIITVVGGAIVTAHAELTISNMKFDFGVLGEGEETMVEFAETLESKRDFSQVNGLIYYDENDGLIQTSERKPNKHLDDLPFPDYEALEFKKYNKVKWITQPAVGGLYFDVDEKQNLAEIVTSRSCPFECTFCYHPLTRIYRQRSLDNVFEEIKMLKETYDINILNLLDELFSYDEERVIEFAKRFKEFDMMWLAQWRTKNVSDEMIELLKESNILTLGFGIESMNDTVLKSMMKKVTKADNENALNMSLEAGLRPLGNIILGDPVETEETMQESIDWWLEHPEHDIYMGFLLPIPDAQVYRYAIANGLVTGTVQYTKEKFPVVNLTKIPDRRFNKIKRRIDFYGMTNKQVMDGKVVKTQKLPEKYEGRSIFEFQIECPCCSHTSTYKYFQFSSRRHSIVLCKNCKKRLKVKTRIAFPGEFSYAMELVEMAYIYYVIYLKKHKLLHTTAQRLKDYLRKLKVPLPHFGGWLSQE